jgi:hydrogenase nickel incorporation protein HypA/HybF
MHELSVSSAILDTALRHAGGRRVSAVHLRVGRLRQVVPDSLDFYFGIVSRDTLCEGARLEQEMIEALMRCSGCGQEWDPAPPLSHSLDPAALLPQFRCPDCEAAGAEIVRGNELEVDSIDVQSAPLATHTHEES